ncbi:hypothetical protein BCR32DRAFT_52008 [Anaeromyces robustus]|uniref:Uncharacterized protein n=1 Tax=Anaeromyces robustus TaxID=1754192 RepID=A0A1Y1WX26_9FUNG|nr:hypothetical protein BCR32DRAFT_52008 [Anaeromyces robustus]|eukprot:ORX78101.1 hypothetical protein BCR32DRAFT_52008 [Anaeromyces robustus]
MIFNFGQIITIGILGGAGGYLIYKSKPSTKRIEAEYYEQLKEKENNKEMNKNNNEIISIDTSHIKNEEKEKLSRNIINTIKNKTNYLKNKNQEQTSKINSNNNIEEEEKTIQSNRLYSNFYENYKRSNEILIKGKENAGLKRRYEDIQRIHNYCKNNLN